MRGMIVARRRHVVTWPGQIDRGTAGKIHGSGFGRETESPVDVQ